MSSHYRIGHKAAGLLLAIVHVTAIYADPTLNSIPASAPLVVHVRGYERTSARFKKTLAASLGDLAPMVTAQFEMAIGSLLAGRELKALAPEGSLFVVFPTLPEDDSEPELFIVADVTNYVQFRDGLLTDVERKSLKATKAGHEETTIDGKPVFFLSRGTVAIVSFHEKALRPYADRNFKSLGDKLDKPIQQKLLANDLAVFVNAKQLNKQYGDKLGELRLLIDQAFQQAESLPGVGKQMAASKKMVGALIQLIEDSDQFVAGVSFEGDGVRLQAHTIVGDKTKSNQIFSSGRRVSMAQLGRLPADLLSYSSSAGGLDLLKLMGMSSMGLGTPLTVDGGNDKELSALATELQGLPFDSWFGAFDYPHPGLQVIRYADCGKASTLHLRIFEKTKENATFGGMPIKGKPVLKRNAETLNGHAFHHVQLTWDFAKFLEAFPEEARDALKATFQKSLGTDMKIWFGTDGTQLFLVNAQDWPAAAKVITVFVRGKGVLAQDAAYLNLRNRLPAEGNLLLVANAGKMAGAIAQSMQGALGIPNVPPPDAKADAVSYFGMVLGAHAKNGSLELWLPAPGIKTMVNVFRALLPGADGN